MESWETMKFRIGKGRRCFGFFHPAMPNEPLVFIEVALTNEISDNVINLTQHPTTLDEGEATCAIFYAIISTQKGLAGIDLGHFLIKRVVSELQKEFPRSHFISSSSALTARRINDFLHTLANTEVPAVARFNSKLDIPRRRNYQVQKYKLFLRC